MFNTRIAPSPTGDMHLGTARTGYFNWLAARASGGKFLLRIDDTDLTRSDPKFTEVILDTMTWLGLDHDLLAFQSQRFNRYREIAESLVTLGDAIRLDNGAIGLVPKNVPDSFVDELAGRVSITANDLSHMKPGDIILMKADGSPSYHWSCVLDDIEFQINYIIRGVDHLTNTSRQVAIYSTLGQPLPKFCHIGLIHFGGAKLSKRDGAASMLYYRDKQYDPDAMLNFMARLGWGPKVDDKTTALLPREKMLELFLTGGKMRSTPANMDMDKLDSFDRKYKARKKNGITNSGLGQKEDPRGGDLQT